MATAEVNTADSMKENEECRKEIRRKENARVQEGHVGLQVQDGKGLLEAEEKM